MVFEEPLIQKGENMFCFLRKFCFFFTVHMSKTLDFNGLQRFTSPVKENIRYSLFVWCEPLWIVAKPTRAIYSANNIKDKSRKSAFYGWQLFLRTAALSAIACVMPDFCYWVQSQGLLSAKSRREISWIKIYTDINLGLYLAILPYKHNLLFSNVCGLNLWTRGHFHLVTTLKRGEGVEMPKLDIDKLTGWTKRVFFGECLNYFCPWL